MPNYVRNVIAFEGSDEEILAMLKHIKNDELEMGSIDFNKLIPMPESLNIECGSRTDQGVKMVKDFIMKLSTEKLLSIQDNDELEKVLNEQTRNVPDESKDRWKLGVKATLNQMKYGAETWYDWSLKNWGTKWNSCNFGEDNSYFEKNTIMFDTAWSAPHPVLEKLAETYPNISFEHRWADEDMGANCGKCRYENGERKSFLVPSDHKTALEFAAVVWEYDLTDLSYHINQSGDDYVYTGYENFELVEMFGKTALFTNEHLTERDVPEGLNFYHFRTDDDGDNQFCTLEKRVAVNNGGTLITREDIDLGLEGFIALTEDTTPNFLGVDCSIDDYITEDYGLTESAEMGSVQS